MSDAVVISESAATQVIVAESAATQVIINEQSATGIVLSLPGVQGAATGAGTDLSYNAATRVLSSSTGTDATLPEATTTVAGLQSAADKTKLNGIAAGAQVNVATNLTYDAASREVRSSTGTDATLPLISTTAAGLAKETGTPSGKFLRDDNDWAHPVDVIVIPVGDEITPLIAGTNIIRFRMLVPADLLAVRAAVNDAPTGSPLIVDINEAGASVLSTKLSIDASETTSTTAAVAAVISDSDLADDAVISIDIDQVGSGTAGAGLKVSLYVRRK